MTTKARIARHGALVLIYSKSDDGRIEDFFLAETVRSITTEWDEDNEECARITFQDGGHIDWGMPSATVAEAVWPGHVEALRTKVETLLDASEGNRE